MLKENELRKTEKNKINPKARMTGSVLPSTGQENNIAQAKTDKCMV